MAVDCNSVFMDELGFCTLWSVFLMSNPPVQNHPDMAWDMAWQTIDTAPRDGTEILCWCQMTDEKHWMAVLHYEYEKGENYSWRDWDGVGLHHEVIKLWQPLPPPPQQDSKE